MSALPPEVLKTFKAPIRLYQGGEATTTEQLAELEREHKISLPSRLREFLLEHGSGMLSPNLEFSVGGQSYIVKDINSPKEISAFSVKGLITFGRGPFGDFYSVSCRRSDFGQIYFEDHESVNPDDWRIKAVALLPILKCDFVPGIQRLATTFDELEKLFHLSAEDWVIYLMQERPDEFGRFFAKHGVEFPSGHTPLVSLAASYGTVEQLRLVYEAGGRAPDLVCQAVRNTQDLANVLRYVLEQGEDANYAYMTGKPYPMGYAKLHRLTEATEILLAYGVPDSSALVLPDGD